ncbi:diguanylate cyclase [Chitinimonas koreensis]|uniref:diguanylate cyclase n=1 Tax=Chitinimonas koreensis TaxID=356302 RepID=UPI0003F4DDEB|nr:diguanylate cyclase [Chitinimonas koreensis]QNM98124.1 diguanylate cyclase [Chitinimonas koreensis]
MSEDTRSEFTRRLEALRLQFQAALPARLGEIRQLVDAAGREPDALQRLRQTAHTLAGTAASYGHAEIGEALAMIEREAARLAAAPAAERDGQRLVRLGALLAAGSPGAPVLAATRPTPAEAAPAGQSVLIVEDDRPFAAELALQLEYFGYRVIVHHEPAGLEALLRDGGFDVAVMDMVLGADCATSAAVVSKMADRGALPPIVFMSSYGDFPTRLEAVRAGGQSFLPKPLDVPALVDRIEVLTGRSASEALRVMIVDDSAAMSELHATWLQTAGMVTRVINDPFAVAASLQEFFPDLILLDIDMPDCDGMELAAVIRQQAEYISLPLIFCSTEARIADFLPSILASGDDYLAKPLDSALLTAKVAGRASRHRTLRSLMTRDSLTHCLNHTRIKESVALEIERARRERSSFAVAMIDIDHFKAINDTHGHPVGDRVIKNLAHLLRQRLRKYDLVGRYGGEEFLVVLPGTTAETAAVLMERMRESFEKLNHGQGGAELHATFSCGIAGFPAADHAEALIERADVRVYEAKRAGRNRVVAHG